MARSVKRIGLVIGSAAILVAGGFIYHVGKFQTHGQADPLQLVDQYLLALAKQDGKSLQQLAAGNSPSERAVQAHISRLGGVTVENRRVFRTHTTPAALRLKVYGSYLDRQQRRQPFEEALNLVYQRSNLLPISSKSWQLVMSPEKL
jgi:hypothetical protein